MGQMHRRPGPMHNDLALTHSMTIFVSEYLIPLFLFRRRFAPRRNYVRCRKHNH
jgi:hypothetical protein